MAAPARTVRAKRNPGEVRALDGKFQAFLKQIRSNSTDIGECSGRVLRLKPTVSSNARPEEINLILEALKLNWRVEVLYIQNFELVRLALTLQQTRCNFSEDCTVLAAKFASILPQPLHALLHPLASAVPSLALVL